MSPRQMQRRCPGAQAVGLGRLDGYRFTITTNGGANVVKAPGHCVIGVVWRVERWHLAKLDGWEGVSAGVYRRTWCNVTMLGADGLDAAGRTVPAVVYLSARRWPGIGKPIYIETAILYGARRFGVAATYQDEIRGWLARRPIGPTRLVYRGRRTRKRRGRR
jgi:gamma-glutamylcyclotransferase (GGCT)/AIG2-like uncharacterized protein YtfP